MTVKVQKNLTLQSFNMAVEFYLEMDLFSPVTDAALQVSTSYRADPFIFFRFWEG